LTDDILDVGELPDGEASAEKLTELAWDAVPVPELDESCAILAL
jgi:hypothetical protein